MKSVLISIQPKWCELIANGKKTVEVRKTRPKIDVPFKCYIYCTIGGDALCPPHANSSKWDIHRQNNGTVNGRKTTADEQKNSDYRYANGKVIGEFVCDYIMRHCNMQNADLAEQQGMIKRELLFDYSNGKELFGWHISDPIIYDKPMELGEFRKPILCPRGTQTEGCVGCWDCEITRPPQSYCYVEELREEKKE